MPTWCRVHMLRRFSKLLLWFLSFALHIIYTSIPTTEINWWSQSRTEANRIRDWIHTCTLVSRCCFILMLVCSDVICKSIHTPASFTYSPYAFHFQRARDETSRRIRSHNQRKGKLSKRWQPTHKHAYLTSTAPTLRCGWEFEKQMRFCRSFHTCWSKKLSARAGNRFRLGVIPAIGSKRTVGVIFFFFC